MRNSWLELALSVLAPKRPRLALCLGERTHHLDARRVAAEARGRAIAHCERQIEGVRAAVFAANDGVVAWRMTNLEREWRMLSRRDPDAGLMDLWARIAPRSWIDRKRWRDSAPAARLDAAIALASDVDGVEAAEAAVESLRSELGTWGVVVGSRVRFRAMEHDVDVTTSLLAEPLRMARAALAASDIEPIVSSRAQELERAVNEALLARFPERPLLASSIAHAAFVDFVMPAARIPDRPSPVASLRAIWSTGYVITSADASGVTLEIPPLS